MPAIEQRLGTSSRPRGIGLVSFPRAPRAHRYGLWQAVLVFVVCLSGCTPWSEYVDNGFKVGPNYCRPPAPVADDWIESDDPRVSSEPPQDAAWWRTFNDPVLDRLIQAAYRQNLTLREAGLRVLEAQALRNIAAGEMFPQLQEAFGDYTRNGRSKNVASVFPTRFFDEWSAGAGLSWELDFWGRFRRAVESADAELDASIEDYDYVLVLLVAEVAQSYVDVRTAEQRLEYARDNVRIQRSSLDIANLRFQNGATTRLDVTQAQSNLSQTESFIPPLEAARQRASNRLCILLGMPPRDLDDVLGGRKPIPSAPPQVAVGIPADLLRRRPDVRRAERQVAAQSARIGIATSELYPHLFIAGSIHFDAEDFSNLFDGGSLAGDAGPSFRWNILNYGRLVNNIRVQDARFQQRAVEYQNTVLRANAEVEDALISFLNSQQQVKSLAESTTASEQSLGLVRDQYTAGRTDFNRVLIVEQDLTRQQDLLAVSQGSVAGNLIQLYKALGGGWQIRLAAPASPPSVPAEPEGELEPINELEPLPAPAPEPPPLPPPPNP